MRTGTWRWTWRWRRGLAAVAASLALAAEAGPRQLAAQQTHEVRGVVVDSAGAPVEGAMVVALALPDSVLTRFALTDGQGRFRITRVPAGSYLLQVTRVGYEVLREPFTVAAADVDAGTLTLGVAAVEMEELVVSVEHVPFVNRRDTLDYNVRAFVTPPNATVEELLKRLPGIEVDSDGTIRAQGQEVQQVLVDGKEFFGSDPTIATRNLPADAVERVQVFDKQSDMAEFTGIADGQEERTINLELREDARRGVFGRVVGGLGGGLQPDEVIEAQPTGRTRYHETLNVNRFSSTTQVALLGGANNVNEPGFAWGDFVSFQGGAGVIRRGGGRGGDGGAGIQLGGGRNDGFTTTLALGANASHDFGEERWLRASYFFTDLENTLNQTSERQQLLDAAAGGLFNTSERTRTGNTSHRLNLNSNYRIAEGHDIRVRGNLNVGSSSMNAVESSSALTLDGRPRNTAESRSSVEGSDLTGNGSLTWRKRLADNGRSLVATVRATVREPELFADLETLTDVYLAGRETVTERVLQEQERTGRTLNWTQRLSWTEPVGSALLEIFGQRRTADEDQDNTVYDLVDGGRTLNDELTSGFERSYSYLSGGVRFNRTTENVRLVLATEVQRSHLEGTILDRNAHVENRFTHLLPSVNLRLQLGDTRTVNARYLTSTREPSMTELQPFADNTNPTRIYVGNPDLTPEYTHRFNADYKFFDEFTFVNLFTYAQFAYTTNAITRERTYDARAVETSRPVNVDHEWSLSAGATYGRPVRRLGIQLNLDYGTSYSRGVELLNGDENRSRSWRNDVSLSVENRDKEVFEVRAGAKFSFNDVAYSLNPELNRDYVDRIVFGEGLVRWGGGWTLSSQFNWTLYDDEVFGAADRNVAMLNASLSRFVMNDRVELSLTAFDLLDQNKGVRVTSGASFLQETRTESLGRYLMLRVNYRLGNLMARGGGFRGERRR